jgi:hypothetical protein
MTPQSVNTNQNQQVHTPQQNQGHSQPLGQAQQAQSQGQQTPQTPSFPSNSNASNSNMTLATPLSPGSESREKERVSLLLDINRELLMEVMRVQAVQAEGKKEAVDKTEGDKPAEKPNAAAIAAAGKDFVEYVIFVLLSSIPSY